MQIIDSMPPLVSIVIPTYNRAALLAETVASLQAQTYPHWEAWVVDDHSTDGTMTWLQETAQGDERIQAVVKPAGLARGAQASRNLGMARSRGAYVIFLDSDDLLAPTCLAERVRVMEETPTLDFAVFPQLVFHKTPGDSDLLINIFKGENDLDRFLMLYKGPDAPWINGGVIWRKLFLESNKIVWDEEILSYQDIYFHINTLLANPNYKKEHCRPDNYIRQHDGERVGNKLFNTEHLKSHSKLFSKVASSLIEKEWLTPSRAHHLAQMLFRGTWSFVRLHRFKEARATWKLTRQHGLVSPLVYQTGQRFILLQSLLRYTPRLSVRHQQWLERKWADSLLRPCQGGFLRHRLPEWSTQPAN